MFIAFLLLWIVLNGRLTAEILMLGFLISAALYAFFCRFLDFSIKKDLRIASGAFRGIRYVFLLLLKILTSNGTVIRMILTPGFEPDSQLVSFRAGLKKPMHRAVLANSITLTPGTITCDLHEDTFVVHCLDRSMMDDIGDSAFLRRLREMEVADSIPEEGQLAGETGENGIKEEEPAVPSSEAEEVNSDE